MYVTKRGKWGMVAQRKLYYCLSTGKPTCTQKINSFLQFYTQKLGGQKGEEPQERQAERKGLQDRLLGVLIGFGFYSE